MSSVYRGVATKSLEIDLLSDGDRRNAASANIRFQRLCDQIASMVTMQVSNWTQDIEFVADYAFSKLVTGFDGSAQLPTTWAVGTVHSPPSDRQRAIAHSDCDSAWLHDPIGSGADDGDSTITAAAYNPNIAGNEWAVFCKETILSGSARTELSTEGANPLDLTITTALGVGNMFVAAGQPTGASPYVITSIDGALWTQETVSAASKWIFDGASNGVDTFILVGGTTLDLLILRGTLDDPIEDVSASFPLSWASKSIACTWNGRVFAILDEYAQVLTSPDGVAWTRTAGLVANASTLFGLALAADPISGVLLAATRSQAGGAPTTSQLHASFDDGVTWQHVYDVAAYPKHIIHGHGRFFFLSEQQHSVRSSLKR